MSRDFRSSDCTLNIYDLEVLAASWAWAEQMETVMWSHSAAHKICEVE